MSPKSAQRFWDGDMHKNKGLKPVDRDALQGANSKQGGKHGHDL
jgi:hypothetical protein